MKLNLKKYLLYSSVFAIFSEAFFFHFIIDWKLLYFIIFINYFVILYLNPIKVNKYFIYLLFLILLHAVLSYTFIQIPFNYFISQLLGIAVVGIYFYNLIKILDLDTVIKTYVNFSFVVVIIGYVLFLIGYNPFSHFNNDQRLMSVLKEPAHYVVVIIPACYYFLKNKNYLKFFITFISILMSTSSLGIIGCSLMFVLPYLNLKKILVFLALLPVFSFLFIQTYNNFEPFKLRVDDTYESIKSIKSGKFKEETNWSSHALISNLFVLNKNISNHPFGSGIGSHFYMFTEEYGKAMRAPQYLIVQDLDKSNATDANSLFTRMVSELGILGIIIILWSVYYLRYTFTSNQLLFSQGIAIYLILKLIRDGHYFPPELYFFIWIMFFEIQRFKNLPNKDE
jgi:hypothetical protein